MNSQAHILDLLGKTNLTSQQRQQLITLLRAKGMASPDLMFENAYLSYLHNPKSDQRYIQLEEIIYNGLALKIEKNVIKKFVSHMRKKLGDNTYIRRLSRFVHYITNQPIDASIFQDLIKEDLSDNESLKKLITSAKRQKKMEQYIERLNKYLSIEPQDEQAWLQLAEIYIEKGHYMRAAFCYEELVVLNPANDVYTLKLCELYLTLSNKSTTDKAIKYLTYLITKRPDYIRALWTLYRAVIGIQQHQQLKQLTYEVINKLYSKNNPKIKIHHAF